MDKIASRISVLLTGLVLLAAAWVLTTIQPEECSPPDILNPPVTTTAATNAPSPTLAPPQKVVVVHVEADRSDIVVGWAEN